MSAPKLCLLVYNQMDTIVVSVINHCEIGVKFNLPHILQILLFDHSSRGCIPTYGRLLTATTMVVISAFRDLFSVQRRLADARYDRQILANEIGKGVEDAGCKMERS